jgi:hypothetical protein
MKTVRSVVLVFLGLAIIAALLFHRSPEVRELVAPRKQTRENPLDFLEREDPYRRPAEQVPASPEPSRPAQKTAPAAQETPPAAEQGEQMPADELSRVLLQILAARRLAGGVSIMVDEESIEVNGEVDSQEKRQQILQIVNSGRGARRVVADGLVVSQ